MICSELCVIADYLGIEALLLDLCDYIKDNFEPVAKDLQLQYNQFTDSCTPLPAQFVQQYIEGAQLAFKDGAEPDALTPLRDAFIHFIPATNYLALRDASFCAALHKVPALSAAVLQFLFAADSPFLSLAFVKLPVVCNQCRYQRKVYASTWVDGDVKDSCLSCEGKSSDT